MTEQDKQVIERLAELLGWSDCEWFSMITAFDLTGNEKRKKTPPVYRQSKVVDSHIEHRVFPPSRLDGNGMLWLMGECDRRGLYVDIDSSCDEVVTFEKQEMQAVFTIGFENLESIPAAVNKAALEALEACNGKVQNTQPRNTTLA